MIRDQSLGLPKVCKDMDLVPSAVRRWVQQLDDEVAGLPGVGKPLTPEQQRIRELEDQIRRTRPPSANSAGRLASAAQGCTAHAPGAHDPVRFVRKLFRYRPPLLPAGELTAAVA